MQKKRGLHKYWMIQTSWTEESTSTKAWVWNTIRGLKTPSIQTTRYLIEPWQFAYWMSEKTGFLRQERWEEPWSWEKWRTRMDSTGRRWRKDFRNRSPESIPAFIEKKERLRLDIHRCRDDSVECSFDLPGRSNLSVFGFDPASDP